MKERDHEQAAAFLMNRRALIGGILAAPVAFSLTGCGLFESRASYRFRMTVQADTPNGQRSGSSVLQVNAVKSFPLFSEEHAGGAGITGEAVAVDLPNGPLFILLTLGDGKPLLATRVTEALDPTVQTTDAASFVSAVRKLGGSFSHAKAALRRENWPMLTRFGDPKNPKSVEEVDPAAAGIKRILLETTSVEVTRGIQKRLPWLTDGGLTLDPAAGPTINPSFAQTLRQRDFSTFMER